MLSGQLLYPGAKETGYQGVGAARAVRRGVRVKQADGEGELGSRLFYDEYVRQRGGQEHPVGGLSQPAVGHLAESEHALDHPNRVLDLQADARLRAFTLGVLRRTIISRQLRHPEHSSGGVVWWLSHDLIDQALERLDAGGRFAAADGHRAPRGKPRHRLERTRAPHARPGWQAWMNAKPRLDASPLVGRDDVLVFAQWPPFPPLPDSPSASASLRNTSPKCRRSCSYNTLRRYFGIKLSSPGESHPRALPEPDVNLSIHPAPIVQPLI
jgi:hypothetical protein